jgi:molybdopterin-guanine dinucleotide biosynthesis protein A
MGRPKLSLPVGDELLLQRVVRILGEVVAPIVVVAAPAQELPPLPQDVRIVRDDEEHLGPLAGIAAGLGALPQTVDAAYLTACDVPLLRQEFIVEMLGRKGRHAIAVPIDGEFLHPLAGVYDRRLAERARELLRSGERRPRALIAAVDSLAVPVDELREVDPELDSLRNVNTPADYESVLALLTRRDQPGDR